MKPKPMQLNYQINRRTGEAYIKHHMTGDNIIVKFCYKCGAVYAPEIKIESLMDDPWYGATTEHYHKYYYCGNELSDKPFNGSEEFDEKAAIKRDQIEEKNFEHDMEEFERFAELEELSDSTSIQPSQPNIPKCPTCGSTNIRRISDIERATGIILFGLLSNKRKYQFECQNPSCKYKW